MEGSIGIVNFQCEQLIRNRFHRVDPELEVTVGLDDWEKIPELVEKASAVDLTKTVSWLQEYWI